MEIPPDKKWLFLRRRKNKAGERTHSARYPPPGAEEIESRVASFSDRGFAEGTKRIYRRVVGEFFRFVGHRQPSDVTPRHVIDWRNSLLGGGSAESTVSCKLTIIRTLFDYLLAGGYFVGPNPASKKLVFPPARPGFLAGRALSSKEVRTLCASIDRSELRGARDYALLLVMLRLALRVSEACGLRISSISLEGEKWVISYEAKGGYVRRLPLPDDVKRAIDEYLSMDETHRKRGRSTPTDECIFQTSLRRGMVGPDKPLSTRAAYNIVRGRAKSAGIGHVSPHDLRRTAITRALNMGFGYREVQMLSGHRNPKTVMIYDYDRENLKSNPANTLSYDSSSETHGTAGRRRPAFVRWKRRQLVRPEADGRPGGKVRYAVLVRSVRINGKPRQKVIRYLGHIRESHLMKPASRMIFWSDVKRKLKDLPLATETLDKVISKLSRDVAQPTAGEVTQLRQKYLPNL